MRSLILCSFISALSVPALAADVTISTDMESSFQGIHESIAKGLYHEMPALFSRSCEEGRANIYSCGEIPVGKLDNESDKNLFNITIPAKSFNQKGFKGTFPATNVKIFMSRKQIGGASIPEKMIGDNSAIKTSSYMGRDIYVKLNSGNNKMVGVACVYVPGAKTKISTIKNSFVAKKKIVFLTSKISIGTTIKVGEGSFDAIKTCMSFQVVPHTDAKTKALSYKYTMIAQTKPQFLNLKRGPIKVEVTAKGANWLGSIVNKFANSIITKQVKAEILKQVSKQVDNIYESDVLDGRWFAKYLNAKNLKLVDSLKEPLKKSLEKAYTPDTSALVASYQKACERVQKTSLAEFKKVVNAGGATAAQMQKLTQKFDHFCGDFASLKISAFLKDSASTAAGCYSGSVRATDMDPLLRPRFKKTVFDCKFTHKVTVKVDSAFKGLGGCMMNQWKRNYSDSCRDEVIGILKYGTQL